MDGPLPYWGADYGTTNLALVGIDPETGGYGHIFVRFGADLSAHELYRALEPRVGEAISLGCRVVAVEGVFKGPSVRTYGRMVRVQFAVELLFGLAGRLVIGGPAVSWRKLLFGRGSIKKEEAQALAAGLFPGLAGLPKDRRGHLLDASLIALYGLMKDRGEEYARGVYGIQHI